MRTYKPAPMDSLTLGSTVAVFALVLLLIVVLPVWFGKWPSLALAGIMAVAVGISWQMTAQRYQMSEDSIAIIRGGPFRDIFIPLAEVRDVSRVTIPTWGPPVTLRLLGVGGLFSWTGVFWNRRLGVFYASLTDMQKAVLIQAGKKYVITPADPDDFIADVKSRLGA